MQNILPIWQSLTTMRKVVVIGSTIAIFLAVLGMSRLASQPRMTLLYSGLDAAAAGEVVQALQQQGAAYEVRGTSVFVDSSIRDQLRLTLASEGLPASTGQGYELLDQLTGFGTTSQMFDAAYLRAKEGELARTIVASPDVATARVHIASGTNNAFRPDLAPSASVHVTGRRGAINKSSVEAIRHLVASAVAGLQPSEVSIVDAEAGLLSSQDGPISATTDQERTAQLKDRVLRLVEARVGRGNAVVEVSIDTVTETESITERNFDPSTRFVISSETEERTDQSENAAGGAVTVASNLPDGDANGSDTETSQTSETRERLNYEVSQITREIIKASGAIKRLTVAVLVNGSSRIDGQGIQVFEPMPDEELEAMRDLVASAVGFDEARGDVITLRSMSIEATDTPLGSLPIEQPWFSGQIDTMSLAQIGILALVALILGLFVVRPLLMSGRRRGEASTQTLAQLPSGAQSEVPVLTGTIEPDQSDVSLPVLATTQAAKNLPTNQDAVDRLKSLIEERRSETVEVLRSWLDEPNAKDAR